MRRLLGHVTVATEHLAMLLLQHAYLTASQQLSRHSPTLSPAERGERIMSAVILLGEATLGQYWITPAQRVSFDHCWWRFTGTRHHQGHCGHVLHLYRLRC
jgi:hypothetical protein